MRALSQRFLIYAAMQKGRVAGQKALRSGAKLNWHNNKTKEQKATARAARCFLRARVL